MTIPRDELILQAHERLGLLKREYRSDRALRLDPSATIVIDASYQRSEFNDVPFAFAIGDHEDSCFEGLLAGLPALDGKRAQPTFRDAVSHARQVLWHGAFRPDSPFDTVVVRTPKGIWTIGETRLARFFPHDKVRWESS